MNTYTATFYGRPIGSIGIAKPIVTTVKAKSIADARQALYDQFDAIERCTLKLMTFQCITCKGEFNPEYARVPATDHIPTVFQCPTCWEKEWDPEPISELRPRVKVQ